MNSQIIQRSVVDFFLINISLAYILRGCFGQETGRYHQDSKGWQFCSEIVH